MVIFKDPRTNYSVYRKTNHWPILLKLWRRSSDFYKYSSNRKPATTCKPHIWLVHVAVEQRLHNFSEDRIVPRDLYSVPYSDQIDGEAKSLPVSNFPALRLNIQQPDKNLFDHYYLVRWFLMKGCASTQLTPHFSHKKLGKSRSKQKPWRDQKHDKYTIWKRTPQW